MVILFVYKRSLQCQCFVAVRGKAVNLPVSDRIGGKRDWKGKHEVLLLFTVLYT